MVEIATDRRDAIINLLWEWTESEIINLHAYLCINYGDPNDEIYDMDYFDEFFECQGAWEAVRAAYYGEFNPTDKLFKLNAYGNLVSGSCVSDLLGEGYIEEMAEYIDENDDACGYTDLVDILREFPTEG